jgi:hypothetical protein
MGKPREAFKATECWTFAIAFRLRFSLELMLYLSQKLTGNLFVPKASFICSCFILKGLIHEKKNCEMRHVCC